ncbi:ferric reductase-like transmembrane domain-containing protein [uncultured Tateyamaria sp.]|uniref:ferric reductase-like transmembrane domain-containing protein n=1 Tax=uncultured Tateyamaria sp. TaxID=455651 RepID=UPI0026030EC9|nr:ferric reductase-like transmembrane domain-containing protein [uncultured Tateyamaria sp.]
MARVAIWGGLALLVLVPLAIAASSPLQASRNAAYVVASLAGVAALGLLTLQPLLARGRMPDIAPPQQRKWHQRLGASLLILVGLHVGGLYLTSPPDALDALLLVSPTPFSVYGVVGMWAILATALLAATWRRLRLPPRVWRAVHTCLAILIVAATIIHAVQIEGTMGWYSKLALCATAAVSLAWVLWRRYGQGR